MNLKILQYTCWNRRLHIKFLISIILLEQFYIQRVSVSQLTIIFLWGFLQDLKDVKDVGKWQCLEEQSENVLSPFKNRNLGTTFSLFLSCWPLSISHMWPVLPWAAKWPSCYLIIKNNELEEEATNTTSKKIRRENFVVKKCQYRFRDQM